MRRLGVVAAASLLALTAACGGKDDLQGHISAKTVKPGYDFMTFIPIYTTSCSGNPSVCTTMLAGQVPVWYHVPTCYRLTVVADDKGDKGGKTCVGQTQWEKAQIGDRYVGPDVKPADRKVETKRGEES